MKKINIISIFVSLVIIAILVAEDFVSTEFNLTYLYYIKPLVWLTIALFCWFFIRKNPTIKKKSDKLILVSSVAIFFEAIYFALGFFLGYFYSPYSRTFVGMIRNIYAFILILIPYEMIRHSLVSSSKSKINSFVSIIVMVCMFLDLELFARNLQTGLSFAYLLGTVLTCIISQVFLNYVSKYCGAMATIVWQVIAVGLNYVVPILPDLNWFYTLLFVTLRSLVCFVLLYYSYTNTELVKAVRVKRVKRPYSALVALFIVVLLLGFSNGIFPLSPTVIISNSMNPSFERGDIVVVNKNGEYDIGTVIQYEHDGRAIIHRIVNSGEDVNGRTYYITQGDNNNTEDNWLVYEDEIDGTFSFVIPKIGYITIWINQLFGVDT